MAAGSSSNVHGDTFRNLEIGNIQFQLQSKIVLKYLLSVIFDRKDVSLWDSLYECYRSVKGPFRGWLFQGIMEMIFGQCGGALLGSTFAGLNTSVVDNAQQSDLVAVQCWLNTTNKDEICNVKGRCTKKCSNGAMHTRTLMVNLNPEKSTRQAVGYDFIYIRETHDQINGLYTIEQLDLIQCTVNMNHPVLTMESELIIWKNYLKTSQFWNSTSSTIRPLFLFNRRAVFPKTKIIAGSTIHNIWLDVKAFNDQYQKLR